MCLKRVGQGSEGALAHSLLAGPSAPSEHLGPLKHRHTAPSELCACASARASAPSEHLLGLKAGKCSFGALARYEWRPTKQATSCLVGHHCARKGHQIPVLSSWPSC